MPVQHHSSSYRNVKKNTSFDPVWTQEPGSAEHAQDVAVWAPRDPEMGKSSGCLICSVDTGTECYFRTHKKKSNRCFLQIYKELVLLQKVLRKCKLSFINLFNTHYKFKHTMRPQQVCRAQNLLITVSGISGAPTLNHKSPCSAPLSFSQIQWDEAQVHFWLCIPGRKHRSLLLLSGSLTQSKFPWKQSKFLHFTTKIIFFVVKFVLERPQPSSKLSIHVLLHYKEYSSWVFYLCRVTNAAVWQEKFRNSHLFVRAGGVWLFLCVPIITQWLGLNHLTF